MGFTLCFPDTSNTCFQSHTEACAIIITYLDLILQFLTYVEQNKASRTLNHMEHNVKHGCEDNPTQHEFAVITIYYQAIGVHYVHEICGPLWSETNVLKLGSLHERVKSHLHKIIADPDLLLGPDMSYETGSLDGKL